VTRAARELADRFQRTLRVAYSREDVVRLGPKRPPIAATAIARGNVVEIAGVVAAGCGLPPAWTPPDGIEINARWREVAIPGPPVSWDLRAAGLAEQVLLVSGALGRDLEVRVPGGARASARVDDHLKRVEIELSAGDPLDEIVLRSYAIGAAHMAMGWVLTEGLAVDPDTGEVHDLTIRSFGVLRASDTPEIVVTIRPDDAPARPRASDAVFAAVAAATWNALGRPVTLPAPRR
jgi:xanthine dehydrogenase small subunit